MKNITILLFLLNLLTACSENSKTNRNNLENREVDTILSSKLAQQEEVKSLVIALSRKKDSLLNVMLATKESMERINENKIDKGIEGVNIKLDELKGQKENLEEQIGLQKQEIDLANKKIELLNEEKKVYDKQKQALWSKGAPPKDFVVVDSLLNGITGKITEQSKRVKILNRNVADADEQIVSINEQRNFLSTKIRENYNAQEIFTEYAQEEDGKIKKQLDLIDEKITQLNRNVNTINLDIASLDFQTKEKSKEEEKVREGRNRLQLSLIIVGLITITFAFLYWIGKRRKRNLKK